MTPKYLSKLFKMFLPFLLILFLSCATSAGMYKKAEATWSTGDYALAIEYGLRSYEIAIDKNKNPGDIQLAQDFLEARFPQANSRLQERGEALLEGRESDRVKAWLVFQELVSLNQRVERSSASYFLTPMDFGDLLVGAKEVAAEVMYDEALAQIEMDNRLSYIEATLTLEELESMLPGYKETTSLVEVCREKGTVTVAFLDQSFSLEEEGADVSLSSELEGEIHTVLMDYMEKYDYPNFLSFVLVDSESEAEDEGASFLIEIEGDLWVSSEIVDQLDSKGTLTWERTYGATSSIEVTRLTDGKSEYSISQISQEQSVAVEFYPLKYETNTLTAEMYNNQFNNESWMSNQLHEARSNLDYDDYQSDFVVWADVGFAGRVLFLPTALVSTGEGIVELPINSSVWKSSNSFLNGDLPLFLDFDDMELSDYFVDEISDDFLADLGVSRLLENLSN